MNTNTKVVVTTEANEVTIEPKNGKVIDLENSDLSVGKIVFKKKEKELPTKFEDLKIIKGYYLDSTCFVSGYGDEPNDFNKNVFPTKSEAEACLALSQLCQLRDAYNEEPLADWCDWDNDSIYKCVIFFTNNKIYKTSTVNSQEILTFKTIELRDKFVENFEELILTAKPLL